MIAALVSALAVRTGIGQDIATVAVWVALALGVSGSIWGGYEIIKHYGAAEVRDEIEDQNNEAGIKGSEARVSRAECLASGGVYDFRAGICTGLAPGNR